MAERNAAFDGNFKPAHVKILAALHTGWGRLLTHWRMWLIFYVSNLMFALLVMIPFRSWLTQAAGHSVAMSASGEFDFTFLTEALRNYSGFSLLCTQAVVIAIAYLIFSAFLVGGALQLFVHHPERSKTQEFLAGGAAYFWRMLRLAGYFLIMQIIVIVLLIGVLALLGLNPKEIESDVRYVQTLKFIVPIYLFVAMVIAMVHDYVKIHLVRGGNPLRNAFSVGIRFVVHHFGSVLLLYICNLALLAGLVVAYFWIKPGMPTLSTGNILYGFLVSQAFLFGRIGVKLLTLSSAHALIEFKTAPKI